MRRWVNGVIAGLVTALAGVIFWILPAGTQQVPDLPPEALGTKFEKHLGLTWLFWVRGPIEPPPEVVVVAINGRTARQLELPEAPADWSRRIHARLIRSLVARGASAIVFDVDFRREKDPEEDAAFAEAITEAERVVLFEWLEGKGVPIEDSQGRIRGDVWLEPTISPIAPLTAAAKGLGTWPLPKRQVAVYQYWVFKSSARDEGTIPAVALQVYALEAYDLWREVLGGAGASGVEDLPRRREEVAGAEDLKRLMGKLRRAFLLDPALGARVVAALDSERAPELDERQRRLIRALVGLYAGNENRFLNFYGPPGTVATVPYHAVIKGSDPNVDPSALDLTGKVAFVGASDLYDPKHADRFFTVFTNERGVDLSGVEIAATAFGNLLTDRAVRPSDPLTTAAILLVFGGVLGAGVYLVPGLVSVPLALVLGMLYAIAVQVGFSESDLWLPLATPMLIQLPMALFLGLGGQYLLERRQKRQVSMAISYYLPEAVAKDLTEKGLDPDSLNKVVHGTCLATDMSGSTTIAETLPPKELASFMNSYFEAVAEPLKRHGVDITEFRADNIMCAWTSADPDAATNHEAVNAALAVLAAIEQFNARLAAFDLYARIGLETGSIYVGHSGGGGQFAYSILGDCANTAARIEGLNKHVGTRLLATRSVVEGVDGLLLRPLGRFHFLGKTEPTAVVEVLARQEDASTADRQLCARFAEPLEAFSVERWAAAADLFGDVLRDYPDDGPARFYFERCRLYRSGAPLPEDPGVIRLDVK